MAGDPASNAAPRAPGSWKRNETSLVNVLKRVLTGNTLSVSEAAQKAIEAGYQTSSRSFRVIVSEQLRSGEQFVRVAPGRYTVKQT